MRGEGPDPARRRSSGRSETPTCRRTRRGPLADTNRGDADTIHNAPPARAGVDLSAYRLVLDEPRDYELLRALFERLGGKGLFGLAEVLAALEAEPSLAAHNRGVAQREPAGPAA